MLDLGGILGFVHQVMAILGLNGRSNLGVAAQDSQGIDHLIVIVHEPLALHGGTVCPENGRKGFPLHLLLLQLLGGQHLIFGIGDGGLERPNGALPGIVAGLLAVDGRQKRALLSQIAEQGEGRSPGEALIMIENAAANAVDGAKGQLLCLRFPKKGRVPRPHVPGGCHRIGHGEDFPRRHALDVEEIPNPAHQHRGFSAARHRQQQHRTLGCLHGRFLLLVQPQAIGFPKCLIIHACPLPHRRKK